MITFKQIQESKKETFTFYEKIIINNIDLSDYYNDFDTTMNPKTVFNKIFNIFVDEYLYSNNMSISKIVLFSEWLRGLPSTLTIPFYNYDILKEAKHNGIVLVTDNEEYEFLEAYFNNCAKAFFTLLENY